MTMERAGRRFPECCDHALIELEPDGTEHTISTLEAAVLVRMREYENQEPDRISHQQYSECVSYLAFLRNNKDL